MARRLLQQSFPWLVSTVLRRVEMLHSLVEWTIHLKKKKLSQHCLSLQVWSTTKPFSLPLLWNTCLDYPLVSAVDPFLGFANNTNLLVFSSHGRRGLQKFPSLKTVSCLNADKKHMLIKIQAAEKLGLLCFRLTSIESSLSLCSPSWFSRHFSSLMLLLGFKFLYKVYTLPSRMRPTCYISFWQLPQYNNRNDMLLPRLWRVGPALVGLPV